MKIGVTVQTSVYVIILFAICFIPWFYRQNKFIKKISEDTYNQNLRMELKIDSLRILRNKDDSIWRTNRLDSLLKNQQKIYDAIKRK